MAKIDTQLCDRCIDLQASAGYDVRIDSAVPRYRRRMKCANCSCQYAYKVQIDRNRCNVSAT